MICYEDSESIFESINLVMFSEQDTFPEANSFYQFFVLIKLNVKLILL